MTRILMLVASVALAGCVHHPEKPPQITFDPIDFQPAKLDAEVPPPVAVIEVPKPLPLPGQLLPAPTQRNSASRELGGSPRSRVEAANRSATLEPSVGGYLNAVQVYPWTEGALYRLYAAPEHVSEIALEPGERLVAVSSGDTVRWVVGDTSSGAGQAKRVHVLVKPFSAGLATNMVITTDRRVYRLALVSTATTAMAAVSWTYPADQLVALRKQAAEADASMAAPVIGAEGLKFRYQISGDRPPWRPVRAFDDGSKVYIEFPGRLDQGEAPPLFVVGPLGDHQLVNYRVRANRYVVDRLFAAAELRMGNNPQQVVRIARTDTVGSEPRR